MIANIVDRRKRQYRWQSVDIIIEPTWHDHSCPDSDEAAQHDTEPTYIARKAMSLADAVTWASTFPVPMTLYIYDNGSDEVPDLPLSHFETES
jgi:hypothetical protein